MNSSSRKHTSINSTYRFYDPCIKISAKSVVLLPYGIIGMYINTLIHTHTHVGTRVYASKRSIFNVSGHAIAIFFIVLTKLLTARGLNNTI